MRAMADKAGVTLSVSPLSARCGSTQTGLSNPTNLLSNAIKFSNEGSTVWLSAELVKLRFPGQGSGARYPADKSRQSLNAFNKWMPLTLVKRRHRTRSSDLPQHRAASWRPDLGGKHPRRQHFFFTLPVLQGREARSNC